MPTSVEVWKPVVGYEGLYEVSDQGRIRSLHGKRWSGSHWYEHPPTLMRTPLARSGYPVVKLTKDGAGKTITIHTVVLLAFVGPRPSGQECRHLNGDRQDARLKNLRWGTPLENTADRKAHGTMPCGINHHAAKLTDDIVRQIRQSTDCHAEIAARYGISRSLVTNVKLRKAWAHVQ